MTYSRCIWVLIAVMAVFTVAGCLLTGLRVDPLSQPLLLVCLVALAAMQWIYSTVRPDIRIQILAETCLQLILVLLFGTVLSYAAAAAPIPFQDGALHAIDTALGLNRRAYLEFFNSRPWLFNTVTLAYFSFMAQFVVVLLVLFFAKQPIRMQQFVFAAGIALFATDAISIFAPSVTTIYMDLGLPVGADIPVHRYTPLPTLQALRSGQLYIIDLGALEGLISFPSFHTIGALLFMWALWHVRHVRWIALMLNVALIAATPITGAHYFIDVAAGFIVAWLAVYAAIRLSAVLLDRSSAATGSTAPAQ